MGRRPSPRPRKKATECEAEGKMELARDWRHVEDALKMMRGPHQS
jgi:hypothetical protein